MLISVIINIIISFVIIIIGHQIWIYLKNNYSVKQKMDLVGSQTYKYKNILHDIQKKEHSKEIPVVESTELVEYISDYGDLKKDLEQYLQEIQK
jgi:hypothetical protein